MRLLPLKKKYIYRHKMLGYLHKKLENEPLHMTRLNITWSNFQKMADDLKVSAKKLKEYHAGFHAFGKDNDHVQCKDEGGVYKIGLEEKGQAAFLDEYWLREGEKEINERIYDTTKWSIPLIALLLTIGSLIYTISKTAQMQSTLTRLQQEVSVLREQSKHDSR